MSVGQSGRKRTQPARKPVGKPASGRPRRPPRIDTDPRFRRRRQVVERTRRRRLLIRAGIASGVVVALWGAFFSPLLTVNDLRVAGAKRTAPAEVIAAARIGDDTNLLRLSGDEIERRVAALPWVSGVEVDRMLPGTVRIRVTERKPRLVLSLGAAKWTLDQHGNVLEAGEAKPGLPVLAGVQVGSVEPGVRLLTTESTAALKVWRSLPPKLKKQVVGIFAPTIERITLSMADGLTIRYGAAEDLAVKNQVLGPLLRRLAREGSSASYVDVRVPGSPAVFESVPTDASPDLDAFGDDAAG